MSDVVSEFTGFDDELSAEERDVRARVRAYVVERVEPVINDYWQRGAYPEELLLGFRELAIVGGGLREFGGPGLSTLAEHLISLELCRGDSSVNSMFGVHSGLAIGTIDRLGSPQQRARWLPELVAMDRIGAFALTEPDHGSDAVALTTRARTVGDGYVLDGEKLWIGNGLRADLIIVWARDDEGEVGAFVVDGETEGLERRAMHGKTADRASLQGHLRFEEVVIDADRRLERARSFDDAGQLLTELRVPVAWGAVGHMIAGYETALAYTREREQFSRPLASFQLVQYKLADMLARTTASLWLAYRTTRRQQAGALTPGQASLAKMHTARDARQVLLDARDLLGGQGVLLEHHVARHLSDIEGLYSYEGTDHVQALVVGREVTGHSAFT